MVSAKLAGGGAANRTARASLVLTMALVLAACGGTATPAPATSAGATGAAPTATPTPDPTPSPSPTPPPLYQAPEDLVVGDCYDPIDDADDGALIAAIIVACEDPHLHEVFGLIELPGTETAPYPGDSAIEDDSITECDAAFEDYVGTPLDDSRYSYVYYTPSDETWADGDRALMCAVEDRGHTIEGSVEGTGQ